MCDIYFYLTNSYTSFKSPLLFARDLELDIQGATAKLQPSQGVDHIIKNAMNNRIIELNYDLQRF